MNLADILRAMQALTPALLQLPAVAKMVKQAIDTLQGDDQATAKEAYADLIADNADGHRSLQDKLAEAARR